MNYHTEILTPVWQVPASHEATLIVEVLDDCVCLSADDWFGNGPMNDLLNAVSVEVESSLPIWEGEVFPDHILLPHPTEQLRKALLDLDGHTLIINDTSN